MPMFFYRHEANIRTAIRKLSVRDLMSSKKVNLIIIVQNFQNVMIANWKKAHYIDIIIHVMIK